jgi:peptidoglycan LD-endopeptidase CwlK
MPIDTSLLVPEFKDKLNSLLVVCQGGRVEMRPYFGLRTPFEQAKLWRQSRTAEEIARKIASLRAEGAPFLAHCIDSVGPQNGAPVTNAIPGLSWHQWGEAVDCVWIVAGKTEWSTQKKVGGINGYRVYAAQAQELELDPGGFWKSLKDWPHVQLRTASSPLKIYSLKEIDTVMQEKFFWGGG